MRIVEFVHDLSKVDDRPEYIDVPESVLKAGYADQSDKSDPLNQIRIFWLRAGKVGAKVTITDDLTTSSINDALAAFIYVILDHAQEIREALT